MESHYLDHLVTSAVAEEVFPRKECMKYFLKRNITDKVRDKRKSCSYILQCRENSLDVFKNIRTSPQWNIQWYKGMNYQATKR